MWESEVVPLLVSDEKGVLQATGVLSWLQDKHPRQYDDGLLSTLQRRIRDWRALHGPPKEVFFEQEHVPGREAAFTYERTFAYRCRGSRCPISGYSAMASSAASSSC